MELRVAYVEPDKQRTLRRQVQSLLVRTGMKYVYPSEAVILALGVTCVAYGCCACVRKCARLLGL